MANEPVSRILSRTAIPLAASLLMRSSDLPGGFRPAAAFAAVSSPSLARRAGTHAQPFGPGRAFPPYLVLLRVGFTMPPSLPPERCALTAPFHPYLGSARNPGGMFSVALAVLQPLRCNPGRYPAHCPAEFGLSSPAFARADAAAAVQPACCLYFTLMPPTHRLHPPFPRPSRMPPPRLQLPMSAQRYPCAARLYHISASSFASSVSQLEALCTYRHSPQGLSIQ